MRNDKGASCHYTVFHEKDPFLPLHAIAMEPYCNRMASVRLSVTLMIPDHFQIWG